jgi:hypothetical protein
MIKPGPPVKRGIAAMVLLFSLVALISGVGFEMVSPHAGPRFGVITQPGGRAMLGVGAVALLVLVALAMRIVLAVRGQGDGDAGDHA